MKTPRIRSFIIAHQPCPLPPCDGQYFTVMAKGDYTPPEGTPFVRHTSGDNIAHRDAYWAELTAMYWVWKHVPDVDYVSFPHYRRLFFHVMQSGQHLLAEKIYAEPVPRLLAALVSENNMQALRRKLAVADCVIPNAARLGQTIASHYAIVHQKEHWPCFIEHVSQLGERYRQHLGWFDCCCEFHPYLMAVLPWRIFDDFLSTTVTLLERMTPQLSLTEGYQARAPGFLAERFFNYFLFVNRVSTLHSPVAILDRKAF
jgi:hypothetical protein